MTLKVLGKVAAKKIATATAKGMAKKAVKGAIKKGAKRAVKSVLKKKKVKGKDIAKKMFGGGLTSEPALKKKRSKGMARGGKS